MITTVETAEAVNHIEVKAAVEDQIGVITLEVMANRTIIEANIKIIEASITTPMVVINEVIMEIIGDEVVVAMVVIITEAMVMAKVIIGAITIITTNILPIMMAIKWNNMDHHAPFAAVLTTLPNTTPMDSPQRT